ncbi:unnamed protein product [Allacma fusca]|uniref:Uncharacterized protein n=1 Tax=Allacma fusca TaxID=39272 RepID=A0A8J2L482_9HEXA|nr:unnamed protein product [Allacma fusca]
MQIINRTFTAVLTSQFILTTFILVPIYAENVKKSTPGISLLLSEISLPSQHCIFMYITGPDFAKSRQQFLENKNSSNVIISNPSKLTTCNSSFHLQLSRSCTIVIYLTPLFEQELSYYDMNWIVHVPGTTFFTYHFLFEENIPANYWSVGIIRRLCNVFVLVKDFSHGSFIGKWDVVVPNRFGVNTSSRKTGILSEFHLSKLTKTFENEWWDFKGEPLRIAASLGKLDMQERMRIYREKRIFNFMPVMISETARILNATPTAVVVNVNKGFGKQLPNKTWDSYIGKIIDDTVHMTLPFTPFAYQFHHVLFSKVVTCSPYVFFAPLPKTQEVTLEFLWKPLDALTWLAIFLCIVVNAVVIYVLSSCTPSPSKQIQGRKWSTMKRIQSITLNMGSFLRVLNDQSFPENMLKQDGTSSGVRIVVLFWLVAMIVITTLYKSVVISELVEPIYIKPPRTFDELLQSDFQVNIILYKALHFENRFPKLKNLKHPIKDRVVDIYGCLKTLLEGDNVCFFVFNYLHLYASEVLLDGVGRSQYLVSKDTFFFTPSSFALSHKNPKLKRVLDRIVDVFIEGSLDSHWVDMDFYQKSLKIIHKKQQENPQALSRNLVDRTIMLYPLLILFAGILIAMLGLYIEVIFYHCRRKYWKYNNTRTFVRSCYNHWRNQVKPQESKVQKQIRQVT